MLVCSLCDDSLLGLGSDLRVSLGHNLLVSVSSSLLGFIVLGLLSEVVRLEGILLGLLGYISQLVHGFSSNTSRESGFVGLESPGSLLLVSFPLALVVFFSKFVGFLLGLADRLLIGVGQWQGGVEWK